jgi:periplasmic protein TonB
MITRVLSSATTSLAITMGLLFGMHLLIATGESISVEPRSRHILDWRNVVTEEPVIVEETVLPKIDKPPVPPPTPVPESANSSGIGVTVWSAPPVPHTHRPTIAGLGLSDGPLVSIIKVQPRYPVAAQTRGLEGTVIVRFDVTPLGTVENVVVVESSNSIFDKAAVEAAYRFKYRPQVIDGTSYGVRGLQQHFRFDMEE